MSPNFRSPSVFIFGRKLSGWEWKGEESPFESELGALRVGTFKGGRHEGGDGLVIAADRPFEGRISTHKRYGRICTWVGHGWCPRSRPVERRTVSKGTGK